MFASHESLIKITACSKFKALFMFVSCCDSVSVCVSVCVCVSLGVTVCLLEIRPNNLQNSWLRHKTARCICVYICIS